MTHLPSVTILIPTYQGYNWLVDLLPILAKHSQSYPGEVQLLCVDSGSTDGTVDLLEQYGAAVIPIPHADFSHGYARNLGIAHAKSDCIVLMSQDALPVGDDWLTRLVHLLDDPKVGAAYVQQLPRPDATPLEEFFHRERYPSTEKVFAWHPGDRITLDKIFFSNVCSITYRNLCLKFPYPETLIMSEDQIFAKSLLTGGYQTRYSSSVAVIHSHHYSLITLFRRNFDSAYSLREITEDIYGTSPGAGVQFVIREIRFLIERRKWLWLAYVPFYEAARIAGRVLGGHADRIPIGLRMRLSLHRSFWQRPNP